MSFSMTAETRALGSAAAIRVSGMLPAVVYGGDRAKSQAVTIRYVDFEKLYNEAGESSLIDLRVEGESEPVKVLIQDIQYDPVKGRMIHVDLRQIKMSEKMAVSVELTFAGEAPAVKELGGTLMKAHDYVNVTCLPKDLVSEIVVDLSVLKTFTDAIRVSDLPVPSGITVTDQPEMVLAKVTPPLTEDQLKAMEEAGPKSVEDIEVEKKGKKEEEGEAAAEDVAKPEAK